MSFVSVVLCTNRIDDFFHRAIQSILSQTYANFELLVVLNGLAMHSYEGVQKKYAADMRVRIFLSRLAFLNHSLNLALEHARGNLIARMDADDISYPNRLEKQVEFMNKNPGVAICGSWFQLIDGDENSFKTVRMPELDKEIRSAAYFSNPLCHPTVMFRYETVAKAGGYIGGLYAEDYDLWLRMMMDRTIRFAAIPEPLLGYRANPTGLARGSKYAYAAMAAAQWNCFSITGNPRWLVASVVSLFKRWILAR